MSPYVRVSCRNPIGTPTKLGKDRQHVDPLFLWGRGGPCQSYLPVRPSSEPGRGRSVPGVGSFTSKSISTPYLGGTLRRLCSVDPSLRLTEVWPSPPPVSEKDYEDVSDPRDWSDGTKRGW